MDENLKKISEEHLEQVAGGANSSTVAPKYKFKSYVKSISHPDLGTGLIVHLGRLSDGTTVYAVRFNDEVLTLPEDDLVPAD